MTNADNIRAMSDEEMAIRNVYGVVVPSGYKVNAIYINSDGYQASNREDAVKYELAWLQAEAE